MTMSDRGRQPQYNVDPMFLGRWSVACRGVGALACQGDVMPKIKMPAKTDRCLR